MKTFKHETLTVKLRRVHEDTYDYLNPTRCVGCGKKLQAKYWIHPKCIGKFSNGGFLYIHREIDDACSSGKDEHDIELEVDRMGRL